MTLRRTILAALLACAALASPAQANFVVGMGDQDAAMFDDPHYQALEIQRVRYLVPFDWFKNKGIDAEVSSFMHRAQADGAEVDQRFAFLYVVRSEDEKILSAKLFPDVAAAISAAESPAEHPV